MNKRTEKYILETTIQEIPWHNLSGPYGRGDIMLKWIKQLDEGSLDIASKARYNIAQNIEHQGTLWHITPFTLVVLQNILRETIQHLKTDISQKDIEKAVHILHLYHVVYETAEGIWDLESEESLEKFEDMLKDEYVLEDGESDDDDYLLEEYYNSIDNTLFMSFFTYSWIVIGYSMEHDFPILRQLHLKKIDEVMTLFNNEKINTYIIKCMEEM